MREGFSSIFISIHLVGKAEGLNIWEGKLKRISEARQGGI